MGDPVIRRENRGFEHLLDHDVILRLKFIHIDSRDLETGIKGHSFRNVSDMKPRGRERFLCSLKRPLQLVPIAHLILGLCLRDHLLKSFLEMPGFHRHVDNGFGQLLFRRH